MARLFLRPHSILEYGDTAAPKRSTWSGPPVPQLPAPTPVPRLLEEVLREGAAPAASQRPFSMERRPWGLHLGVDEPIGTSLLTSPRGRALTVPPRKVPISPRCPFQLFRNLSVTRPYHDCCPEPSSAQGNFCGDGNVLLSVLSIAVATCDYPALEMLLV